MSHCRWVPVVLITAILGAGCGSPGADPPTLVKTWFDAPLDGSSLPLAQVEIVSHSTAPGGVAEVEISVNGAVHSSGPPSDTQATLVTVRRPWVPEAPGSYTLQARARGNDGSWGDSAQVVVTILADTPEPPPTPMATATPTAAETETSAPTDTPSPTPTGTETPEPTVTPTTAPSATPTVADVQFPVVSISHSPSGTGVPNQDQTVTFTANASDNVGVVRIEIWVTPPGGSAMLARACTNTTTCVYQGGPYTVGDLIYLARAWDAANNLTSTFPTTIFIFPVVQ